jgi:hypothetical protein
MSTHSGAPAIRTLIKTTEELIPSLSSFSPPIHHRLFFPFQMKTVLSNPEPLAALSSLVKSQLIYYASSAEALQAAHAEIEESALAAEAAYRGSRQ